MRGIVTGAILASSITPFAAWAAPPLLADLLKQPRYGMMVLSPSGEHVAATVPLDDRTVLAIVRLADMQVTAQVNPGDDGYVDDAIWVGDERLLAQWSMKHGGAAQPYTSRSLYAVDTDGGNRRHFHGSIVSPLLSDPDHVLIGVCVKRKIEGCETRIERVRTDGRGKAETVVDGPAIDAWFTTNRKGDPVYSWVYDDDDVQALYRYHDGGWAELNDETSSGVEIIPVGTSHDGQFGFLWSERTQGPDVIERIDLRDGSRRIVAEDAQRDPHALVWSFDGSEPIGAAYGMAAPEIRFFDDRHPHVALSRELSRSFPGEFARVTSSSRDGRKAVVTVTSDREPGRYYLLDIQSGDMKLLARSRPWLAGNSLRPAVPFELAARDGTPIDGYLTLPEGNEAAKAPLVVLVHGGPFGVRDGWEFDEDTQILAAHGYAVLRVNFRGSSGRGRDYIEKGYRQWGRAMQDDVTLATRWAMSQAGVDASRVCIWGASYGAYAALMGSIREPGLYRCAIGMAGPYDLPTMFRWGDVRGSEWGRRYLERTLGKDEASLRDVSPSHRAGEIKAAILLVQGGRDRRVSPEHLRSMRRALDNAGVPYETYLPPAEGHAFFAEKSRREYYERVLAFLASNMKR